MNARSPLTPRETQICERLAEGKTDKIIAYELRLSRGTVKQYMLKIFQKLGLDNRTKVAVWMVKRQLAKKTDGI